MESMSFHKFFVCLYEKVYKALRLLNPRKRVLSCHRVQSSVSPTPVSIIKGNKGQLIVEYILLLFVVVWVVTFMTKSLIGRGEDKGIITTKWIQILTVVGKDIGD